MTRIVSIPSLGVDFDTSKPALEAIIEAVETGQRVRNEVLNSFVKVGDLVDLGLLQLSKSKALMQFEPNFAAPIFENSWTDFSSTFSSAGYYRDAFGRVYLKGVVASGAVPSTIFTLPAGFRPDRTCVFVTISNGAIGRCDVTAGGAVQVAAGSSNYFSLDGLSFVAVQ